MGQLGFELLLLLDQVKAAQCIGIGETSFDGVEALGDGVRRPLTPTSGLGRLQGLEIAAHHATLFTPLGQSRLVGVRHSSFLRGVFAMTPSFSDHVIKGQSFYCARCSWMHWLSGSCGVHGGSLSQPQFEWSPYPWPWPGQDRISATSLSGLFVRPCARWEWSDRPVRLLPESAVSGGSHGPVFRLSNERRRTPLVGDPAGEPDRSYRASTTSWLDRSTSLLYGRCADDARYPDGPTTDKCSWASRDPGRMGARRAGYGVRNGCWSPGDDRALAPRPRAHRRRARGDRGAARPRRPTTWSWRCTR